MTINKLCARCHRIIEYPNTYCDVCKEIVLHEREEIKSKAQRKYNQSRSKEETEFYNSKQWKMLSEEKKKNCNYKCEDCTRRLKEILGDKYKENDMFIVPMIEEVHHLIEINEDWDLRYDYNNLIGLCSNCHNIRHKRYLTISFKRLKDFENKCKNLLRMR